MPSQFIKHRFALLRRDDGWVLMDAAWSSVVVILAFMATFMAMDSGNKTAVRDITRTAAYDIAQDEMSNQRALGKRSITDLLATNNTAVPPSGASRQITINNKVYRIWYQAYYVTGLGKNSIDACGGSYAANGWGTAKFIYIKVSVDYPGRPASTPMPMLEEYFAPEGGDTNAATGTLRVYLLKPPADDPYTLTTVTLRPTGVGMNVSNKTEQTGASGCVLFTGLPRGDYDIAVSTPRYDIYLNNPTGNELIVPIRLPERSAMSKDIRMEAPVTVTPEFWTTNGTSDVQITPNPGSTTAGPPDYVGPWAARSGQILKASGSNFTANPGTAFLPHQWLTTPTGANNFMYPEPNGYDTFAGPCDVNAPTTLPHIPTTGNSTWAPNNLYQEAGDNPRFVLPRLQTRIWIAAPGDTSTVRNREITWNSSTQVGTGRTYVKLVGVNGAAADTSYAVCGANAAMFRTWERLKGTMYQPDGSTSTVSNPPFKQTTSFEQQVVPTGKYEVCMRADVRYEELTSTSPITWTPRTQTRFKSYAVATSNAVDVGPTGVTTRAWDPFADVGSTTDCTTATGQVTWTP